MKSTRRIRLFCSVTLVLMPSAGLAQQRSGPAPGFTREQAAAGRQAYRQHCAVCHGADLQGEQMAPGLSGARFDQTWRGKTADVIAFHVRRMPPESVAEHGNLGEETYTNILAYIFISNGLEAGDAPLPSDVGELKKLLIPALEGVEYDPDAPVADGQESELLKNLPAVTDDTLLNPSPNDWLLAGRTYNGHGFSPLSAINRENIGTLAPAWRAPLRNGTNMPTPMVHRGVMYLHTFPDTVLALDAANGKVLWRYRYKSAYGSSQKMGLGLHGDRVFVPTSDLHVLALNAKTGELIWDHEIAPSTPGVRTGYQLRSAPLVVRDKVIQGVTASFVPKGGFILAIDINSGKEVWRFNTIARPGEPHGESWNDVPLEKRSGGSVWHQGTYDPELHLVYYGVAPTYDTGPLVHPVDKAGVSSEAYYTNCTIALDPDTGKLVWYYQHIPNDQWDLDWVFERQIVDVSFEGKTRKAVVNLGKMAILEALDAATGEYLFSVDTGVQNVITRIDPKTGAKTIDPGKWPDPERPCVVCPSAFGARSWPQTSYSPLTNLVYVPLTEWCMELGPGGSRLLTSGVGITSAPHPDDHDGMLGRLQAVDVVNRKLAWAHNLATPISTAALATAGGVVFAGDMEPSLKAFDDRTGELLWKAMLDDMPSSNLVTYSVEGRQYVAVVVGMTNFHINTLLEAYRRSMANAGTPLGDLPKGGAAIWVFALP